MLSAAVEVASLVWMEIAMLCVAALLYFICIGGSPLPSVNTWLSSKKAKAMDNDDASSRGSGETDCELKNKLARGDHLAVLKCWQQLKAKQEMPQFELSSVVHSMQKLGRPAAEIIAELQTALASNASLLPSVAALPTTLLCDDAVELLDGTLKLLEEHKQPAELAVYAGLMQGLLRRRSYAAVTATAQRVSPEALTPKMRAMLVTAAAYRGCLGEAVRHMKRMPVPLEGARSLLAPGVVMQALSLSVREKCVGSTASELQRIKARLEAKHLDELLMSETTRAAGVITCRELIDAGIALGLPKGPRAYQALALTFTASGQAAEVKTLIEELETQQDLGPSRITVGEPLAVALLQAAQTLKDEDLVPRVVELHRLASAGAPGVRVLSTACHALIACGCREAACDFYEQEMSRKRVRPDVALTSALQKVAQELHRHELVQHLTDHAERCEVTGGITVAREDLQQYAIMIKRHTRERDLASATRVFGQLRSSGVTLSPLIYNCYLDACVQCGDLEGAKAHFNEMKQLDFLDVVGYNTILKAYLSNGCAKEVHALVKEMTARGLQANKVTYNELLHARVLAQDRRGLWSIVDEMSAAGVRANSVTCSILLKSLAHNSPSSDVKRVIELIDEVEEPIDEVLCSSVIEACIRIKQLELLSDWMRRYRQKGGLVNLTVPTYGSMIKAYGQSGNVARVRELWNEMEERSIKPTSITLGCMTEALVANNLPEEAWDLILAQSQSEERKGCINTVIYSTVLKGFALARRIDKVFCIYKEMRNKNIPCNTITYNTMLDACAKCCTMDRAPKLFEDMRESTVEPDIITYSTLVKGYCLEGDVDKAFSVLEDMKSDDKFAPDEIMYNSILDGCAKQHRVDEALRVLEEMKTAGVIPSNYTLSILVKLLSHARRLSQAFKMVEELSQKHGFRPNVQVYTCLVQACLLNRRLERAMTLHDTMMADAGCTADEKFYAVLARGCMQLHQPLKAVEVVRAAFQLPGHSLAEPANKHCRPIGVESRALDELAGRLRSGGQEESDALTQLKADLLEYRGVHLGDGTNSGGGGKASGGKGSGGKGSGGKGDGRSRRGGANRSGNGYRNGAW